VHRGSRSSKEKNKQANAGTSLARKVGRIVRAIGQQGKTRERRTGGEFALTVAAWAVFKVQ